MKTFNERVYEKLKKVPKGKVVTYKTLAESVGSKAYRAAGNAMRDNMDAPLIPCHRVISNSGYIGGFCGKTKGKKIKEKIELLKKEGVVVRNNKIDLKRYLYRF